VKVTVKFIKDDRDVSKEKGPWLLPENQSSGLSNNSQFTNNKSRVLKKSK
jgi:hypothetical protein